MYTVTERKREIQFIDGTDNLLRQMETKMNVGELAEKLVSWIRERVLASECKGVVLGMSGGVDSSVVAVLCQQAFSQNMLGVLMPCYSSREDEEHALAVANKFSIPTKTVVLDSVFDTLLKVLPNDSVDPATSRLAKANLKVRLRMLTLYYFANQLKYMVVGAGNIYPAIPILGKVAYGKLAPIT